MSAVVSVTPSSSPLWLLAGCHGAMHWALGSFYVLLPFIQQHLGLSYAETGLLASTVHVTSLIANVPSGVLVDVTGKRLAFALIALVFAASGMLGLGVATGIGTVMLAVGVVAAMNTLWHPAAISYLSATYPDARGRALSFHTVGASVGDALAPVAIGLCVVAVGWQQATIIGAIPPVVAALVLWSWFSRGSDAAPRVANAARRGLAGYLGEMRQVVRDARVWAVCLMAGLRGTCQVGLRAFLPLYVVNELGASAVWVGAVIFVFQAAGVVSTPWTGSASDRLGRRPVLVAGLLVSAVMVALMPHVGSVWQYALLATVTGASLLSLRPVVQGWALDLTPPSLGGSTITIVFAAQAAFAMVVPVLSGIAADRWGLAAAFYLFAIAAVAAAGVTMALSAPTGPARS